MLTCYDVAGYFLSLADEESGDLISNLQLQKLVYYAQGFHLAMFGKPLFSEEIEAWKHGPVIPALYQEYKKYGYEGIPAPEDLDFSRYDDETKDFLDEIYQVFGQFSGWKLRNMTHDEPPWRDYEGTVIPQKAMKEYFSTQLKDD